MMVAAAITAGTRTRLTEERDDGAEIERPLVLNPFRKTQGLTLSHVAVDLDRGAFSQGQVYVALTTALVDVRSPGHPHMICG
jgi:hypothetical protein